MTYGPHPQRQPPFNAPYPPQQMPHQPPAYGPQPVVIDVGGDAKVKAVIGGSVAGVIGLFAIFSALGGLTTGGAGGAIAGGVLGLLFLFIGLLPIITWKKLSRPRKLVFDGFGVRWDDPQGRPWAVAWTELSGVGISRTQQRRVKPADYLIRKTMVRLDLFPGDQGFRQRHPEMEHLWEFHTVKNGYRLPLGSNPKYIPVIERAMGQYRPGAYLGVKDEGFMVGLV
ncbi:hypothetical protein SAMN05444920_114270 [Nonomuraea solani]|uniref:Uncharacterized protein n=1 Tax=Nonomuraea solani TaxID=1144553 RepID=A0A1H6ETH8_9ACTN|nr:hypothetical protein [Nonomuraea solani]SEG99994.1 hypothetical protein SAMN05444920_114270 [Nonomuraea solani]